VETSIIQTKRTLWAVFLFCSISITCFGIKIQTWRYYFSKTFVTLTTDLSNKRIRRCWYSFVNCQADFIEIDTHQAAT
jgi:hypothetical protein